MDEVQDNKKAGRYELQLDGDVAFAEYREGADGVRAITHVETPEHLRGRGVAAKLMDGVVADARARNYKLRPVCPYAVVYFKRYPNARDVSA
ncbi:MAG: GNAT family N-acetyltransferase [Terricaulis sp.]